MTSLKNLYLKGVPTTQDDSAEVQRGCEYPDTSGFGFL